MMKIRVYKALERLNELEKNADRLNDKADDKRQEGKVKSADRYEKDAEDITKEISGMVSCLKILGFNAWRECNRDTNYCGVWHIPLDEIDLLAD